MTPDRPTHLEADRDAADDERDELVQQLMDSAYAIGYVPRAAAERIADRLLDAGWHR